MFHWHGRRLEDPHYDLLIVAKDDPAELAFFRKKTTPDFIDPASRQLDRLVTLRKASKKGAVVPEDYDTECEEIADRLLNIMNGAKLRQIPKRYEKDYKATLLGISQVYRSLRYYEEAMATETRHDREKLFKESISQSHKARTNLEKTREVFQ